MDYSDDDETYYRLREGKGLNITNSARTIDVIVRSIVRKGNLTTVSFIIDGIPEVEHLTFVCDGRPNKLDKYIMLAAKSSTKGTGRQISVKLTASEEYAVNIQTYDDRVVRETEVSDVHSNEFWDSLND